jgi:hypothetical protein
MLHSHLLIVYNYKETTQIKQIKTHVPTWWAVNTTVNKTSETNRFSWFLENQSGSSGRPGLTRKASTPGYCSKTVFCHFSHFIDQFFDEIKNCYCSGFLSLVSTQYYTISTFWRRPWPIGLQPNCPRWYQSAFVKGRCIHDNFILVQQTAKALHHQNSPRVLLKLDINKAFDSVSWPFLLEVLAYLGFGPCNTLIFQKK